MNMSIFTHCKSCWEKTRITSKIILAHFWSQLGGNKNGLQKDLKLSEWMSYPNSLNGVYLCFVVFLYRNIANLGNFWSNFCLIHSSYWFYDHFFAWNHGTQIYFLYETQKCGEKLNNNWIITFYIEVLAIFGQIFASFTPPIASQAAFLPEIIVGWYSPLG